MNKLNENDPAPEGIIKYPNALMVRDSKYTTLCVVNLQTGLAVAFGALADPNCSQLVALGTAVAVQGAAEICRRKKVPMSQSADPALDTTYLIKRYNGLIILTSAAGVGTSFYTTKHIVDTRPEAATIDNLYRPVGTGIVLTFALAAGLLLHGRIKRRISQHKAARAVPQP